MSPFQAHNSLPGAGPRSLQQSLFLQWPTFGSGETPFFRAELGVIDDDSNTCLPMERLHGDFCSTFSISSLGKPYLKVRGLIPCISRMAKLPTREIFATDGYSEDARPQTAHHYAMHGQEVKWISVDDTLANLPAELHYIQLCISKHRSHRLTCHVMVVALYEQNRSTIRIGSKSKSQPQSFQDVFFNVSKQSHYCSIHHTQNEGPARALHESETFGAHPDFLRGRYAGESSGGPPIERASGTGWSGPTATERQIQPYNVQHQQGEKSDGSVSCADCKRLLRLGDGFKGNSRKLKEHTRLYLARRLGIGEIVLEA